MDARKNIENRVCILGAGIMGVGLAHNFAEHGFEVVLVDSSKQAVDSFERSIAESYKIQCLFGSTKATLEEITGRIFITNDIKQIGNSLYIIESTTENVKSKINLLSNLKNYLNENIVVAINTSCIPIGLLNQHIKNPCNMLGIHFMNPVPIKSTVEIIKTKITSASTLAISVEILNLIGKNGIVVNDSPGFVINRVFMVTINEAIKTYEEGLCNSAKEIDDLFTKCLGYKMGPLMTADLIGLDTILYSLQVLYDELKNDMYRPANLLVKLVDLGKFGKKRGAGIYDYL